jgi:hypothetical protein
MDKGGTIPAFAYLLFAAIIFYGLFGSPTPDDPGLVEAIVGILLVLSVIAGGFGRALRFTLGQTIFLKCLQVFFLCGLVLPTLSGAYFGNDHGLIVRDLLAFAFLGLPLFLAERFDGQPRASDVFSWLLVFAGMAFAVRTLLPVFKLWRAPDELLYLSNSPLTLFAAVLLAGMLWSNLLPLTQKSMLRMAGAGAMLAVILAAMLLDVQRATIGAVFVTIYALAIVDFVRAPKRAALPLLVLLIGTVIVFPLIGGALQAMADKTAAVGLNARVAEAQAVVSALSANPVTFFTGHGWGSTFSSPAVGGLEVNYTHSFLTTLLLKGGLILLALGLVTIVAAFYEILFILKKNAAQGMALAWTIAIPVFLYASHKSLDFGLALLLLGVWSIRARGQADPVSIIPRSAGVDTAEK